MSRTFHGACSVDHKTNLTSMWKPNKTWRVHNTAKDQPSVFLNLYEMFDFSFNPGEQAQSTSRTIVFYPNLWPFRKPTTVFGHTRAQQSKEHLTSSVYCVREQRETLRLETYHLPQLETLQPTRVSRSVSFYANVMESKCFDIRLQSLSSDSCTVGVKPAQRPVRKKEIHHARV